jgi:hypothetical protein
MSDESKYEAWYKQEENRQKRRSKRRANVHVGPTMASIWLIGWLFSIGYLHMPFFCKGYSPSSSGPTTWETRWRTRRSRRASQHRTLCVPAKAT